MNQEDLLSKMGIDTFIHSITYLPFQEVINVCSSNVQLHTYCNDSRYNNNWKRLIDDTFGNIYGYEDNLNKLWEELDIEKDVYNYLVYTRLVKLLDPISQAMIYYKQGDMKSFESIKKDYKFLALFLLSQKDKLKDYLPNDEYNEFISFITMPKGGKIDQIRKNIMFKKMASGGNVQGSKYFIQLGADNINGAMIQAIRFGHLELVKYLVEEQGGDIHYRNDDPLISASLFGYLDIVKYLLKQGADIHAQNNKSFNLAKRFKNVKVVDYLIEQGGDINA